MRAVDFEEILRKRRNSGADQVQFLFISILPAAEYSRAMSHYCIRGYLGTSRRSLAERSSVHKTDRPTARRETAWWMDVAGHRSEGGRGWPRPSSP